MKDTITDVEAKLRTQARNQILANNPRQTREKFFPHSKEFLTKRKEFAERWEALTREGEEKKYLEWTNDYPGSVLQAGTDTGRRMYVTETDEEYEARLAPQIEAAFRQKMKSLEKLFGDLSS